MRTGMCGLCGLLRELRDSHLIPKGLYANRRRRDLDPSRHPVLLSQSAALMTSAQARAYLLCNECEQLLNRAGEGWVIQNCWHGTRDFPLHAALSAARPIVDYGDFRAYDGRQVAEIDFDRLIHFGASVFWRSAACDWEIGKKRLPPLRLGPYREQLRLFLLSKASFPEHIVMLVYSGMKLEDDTNGTIALPWLLDKTTGYRRYRFVIPGVTFLLFVGGMIPQDFRQICTVRRGTIYMSASLDEDWERMITAGARNVQLKGELSRMQTARQARSVSDS